MNNLENIFNNLSSITGLPFVPKGKRMIASCYIDGTPHRKKDKTYAVLKNGKGIFIKENGGDDISLQEWMNIYGRGSDKLKLFRDSEHVEVKQTRQAKQKRIFVNEEFIVDATIPKYYKSYLYLSLSKFFGKEKVDEIFRRYHVGEMGRDRVVFWYKNEIGKFCHDAIVVYNSNGKRNKDYGGYRLHTQEKGYTGSCLFGSHLIKLGGKPIAVVESEKTALIMSMYDDSKIWVATGGSTKVIGIKEDYLLYPDYDNAGSKWECINCTIPFNERRSSGICLLDLRGNKTMWDCSMANKNIIKWWEGEEVYKGWDIGDLILEKINR